MSRKGQIDYIIMIWITVIYTSPGSCVLVLHNENPIIQIEFSESDQSFWRNEWWQKVNW